MILAILAMTAPAAADTINLFAAGSLKAALTDVAKAYEAVSGNKVEARYGPSGLLKNEISKGANAAVFASANMEHVGVEHTLEQARAIHSCADIFLTYCTNALTAQKENPGQQIVALPDNLAVGADYGLTVVTGASPAAQQLADFIMSPLGQKILTSHGFAPVTEKGGIP
jgi:ABC-type molybdate transport system substrate-binding protein